MTLNRKIKSWLLKSKVAPPRRQMQMIDRPKLIDQLNAAPKGGVVFVQAPAGYGKTSLVAEWRQNLMGLGKICAWVCLDEGDDSELVLAHIAYAFHLQGVDCSETGLLDAGEHGRTDLLKELRMLLAILESNEKEFTIIFDDTERCEEEVLFSLITHFVRWAPTNLSIIFSGRNQLSIDVVDLALRGLLLSIGSEDLKFDQNEIKEILDGHQSEGKLKRIVDESRGWPALVQLMKLGNMNSSSTNDNSTEAMPQLFEHYLDGTILSSLTEQQINFLLDASIFNDIPLDFFMGQSSETGIDCTHGYFYGLNEFILPLEDEPNTLRMHPLLRERLRFRLYNDYPERATKLHRQAAIWLAEQGKDLAAMRHSSKTKDLSLVEDILFHVGGPAWLLFQGRRHLNRINKLIVEGQQLSEKSDFEYFPLAHLTDVIYKTKMGKNREAYGILKELEAKKNCLAKLPLDRQQMIEFSTALATVSLDCYSLTPLKEETIDVLIRHEASNIESTPSLQGSIWNVDSLFANEQSDFKRAISSAQKSISKFRAAESRYGEAHLLLLLSSAYLAQGNLADAKHSITEAGQFVFETFSDDLELNFAHVVLQNEVQFLQTLKANVKIERLASHFLEKVSKLNIWFDFLALSCTQVVDGFVMLGKTEQANRFLNESKKMSEARGYDRLSCFLDLLKLGITSNKKEVGLSKDHDLSVYVWREQQALAEAIIQTGRPLFGHPIEFAEQALGLAVKTGNLQMEIRLVHGLANRLWKDGMIDESMTMLSRGCRLGIEFGLLTAAGLNVDMIREVLNTWDEVVLGHCDEPVLFKIEIQKMFEKVTQILKPSMNQSLTEMEMRVVTALEDGGSDKQLARQLDISHNTVRFHLKNIYKKLNVSNRAQAANWYRSEIAEKTY